MRDDDLANQRFPKIEISLRFFYFGEDVKDSKSAMGHIGLQTKCESH